MSAAVTVIAATGQFSAASIISSSVSPSGFADCACLSAFNSKALVAMVMHIALPTQMSWSTDTEIFLAIVFEPRRLSVVVMSLSLKSSLVARLGAFYQRGNGRSTDLDVFFQPHFERRSGFVGPAGNIGRFFFRCCGMGLQ